MIEGLNSSANIFDFFKLFSNMVSEFFLISYPYLIHIILRHFDLNIAPQITSIKGSFAPQYIDFQLIPLMEFI